MDSCPLVTPMMVIASGIWEWSWCERQMRNRWPSSHSKVLVPWIASPGSIGWAPSVSHRPMKRCLSFPVSPDILSCESGEAHYAHGTALDAATGLGTQREKVIEWLRSIGAHSGQTPQ